MQPHESHPMSETGPDAATKVARNLTAIGLLAGALETQAVHQANHPDMPGGDALACLADVASPEAWEHTYETAETLGRDTGYIDDHDDWEPPLQTLLFWSEQWRAETGYLVDLRPTIGSETKFIRWALDWAWDHEPHFDDFAADIHQVRLRLENIVHAGHRPERSRVVCDRCEDPPRLVKVYGSTDLDDTWRCPTCRHRFDGDAYLRAQAAQLRGQGAERWVPLGYALDTLRTLGRPERTIRQWILDETIPVVVRTDHGPREVWWPDLWRLHLATPLRHRGAGVA
jgi:ribosomal protein L37AE/L43A